MLYFPAEDELIGPCCIRGRTGRAGSGVSCWGPCRSPCPGRGGTPDMCTPRHGTIAGDTSRAISIKQTYLKVQSVRFVSCKEIKERKIMRDCKRATNTKNLPSFAAPLPTYQLGKRCPDWSEVCRERGRTRIDMVL